MILQLLINLLDSESIGKSYGVFLEERVKKENAVETEREELEEVEDDWVDEEEDAIGFLRDRMWSRTASLTSSEGCLLPATKLATTS